MSSRAPGQEGNNVPLHSVCCVRKTLSLRRPTYELLPDRKQGEYEAHSVANIAEECEPLLLISCQVHDHAVTHSWHGSSGFNLPGPRPVTR